MRSRCGSTPRIRRAISGQRAACCRDVALPGGRARRDLDRGGHGGHAVLRPDAGEDHRARGDRATRAIRQLESALAQTTRLRHRDESATTCAAVLRARCSSARRAVHAIPARARTSRARQSKCSKPGTQSRCRSIRGGSVTGTWACRRRGRWMRWRSASRIASSAIAESARGAGDTGTGPTLKFGVDTSIALTGARMARTLDGKPVPYWQPVRVRRAACCRSGAIQGGGQRAYLAVAGGFDVPPYLAARATFTLGSSAAMRARVARRRRAAADSRRSEAAGCRGDLHLSADSEVRRAQWNIARDVRPARRARFFHRGRHRVFFAADWEVHYNSSRTGVRLIGPKPTWARTDGGEAGLHPSNIHDNAYAIGAVDFTGDMPVILGPDGPSLGGFVCPATSSRRSVEDRPASARRPHALPLRPLRRGRRAARDRRTRASPTLQAARRRRCDHGRCRDAILRRVLHATATSCYRQSGDDYCWSSSARQCWTSSCASVCTR